MSGSTGERPFGDIITSIRYWVIHSVTVILDRKTQGPSCFSRVCIREIIKEHMYIIYVRVCIFIRPVTQVYFYYVD
jgi:hypothetical protein